MFEFFSSFLTWLRSLFFKTEMELTLNSGKTTLVNVMTTGKFDENLIPTVGFNMRKVTKGAVVIKAWDVGGQNRFRQMWARYCRGVHAIVFVVDAADGEKFDTARKELHELLGKPELAGIPVLVLGNKNDLSEAVGVDEMVERLELKQLEGREVCCYSISCKSQDNIDNVMEWLVAHANGSQSGTGR